MALKPRRSKTSPIAFGSGAAYSTNSKPSVPIGFSQGVNCIDGNSKWGQTLNRDRPHFPGRAATGVGGNAGHPTGPGRKADLVYQRRIKRGIEKRGVSAPAPLRFGGEGEGCRMRIEQRLALPAGIAAVARPAILGGVPGQTCAYRVQLDVAIARQHVSLRIHQAGAKASFPQGSAAAQPPVQLLDVALAEAFHEGGASIGRARRDEKMHMVGHQAVRVHRAAEARREKVQIGQITEVIEIAEKAAPAIIPPLHDMDRTIAEN